MTANKFPQDVGAIFSAAAAPFCYEEDAFVVASDKTGAMLRTDNGVRAWRFKTQQLRTYLEGAYPELKAGGRKESDVHDDSPEQDDHEQDDDGWQHVCPCVSPSVNISVSRNRQRACLTKPTGRGEPSVAESSHPGRSRANERGREGRRLSWSCLRHYLV